METKKIFFWILVLVILFGFVYVAYVGFFQEGVFYSNKFSSEKFGIKNQPCGNSFLCKEDADCPNLSKCINGVCLT